MAGVAKDMTGKRFGRLTVLARDPSVRRHRGAFWRCKCDCGNETVAPTGHLNAGQRISCGCAMAESKTIHGKSHSPEYKAWDNARDRCGSPSNLKYHLYGGRGIQMCEEWAASFAAFYRDMGDRPSPKHSLDRIDGDGNYEPTNCRWATIEEQNNNRSFNRHVVVTGKRMTVAEASRKTGIPHATITGRLNRGWPDEEAVSNGKIAS